MPRWEYLQIKVGGIDWDDSMGRTGLPESSRTSLLLLSARLLSRPHCRHTGRRYL
jgi:hypothetical protein